jgi:hypothetical protein
MLVTFIHQETHKMDTLAPASHPAASLPTPENPHVLWRQVLGFVLWVGLPVLPCGGPVVAMVCLALGGVTFADAWKSGIYKHPGKQRFLNISPMAWGILMSLFLIVAYPIYVLNRNKLRTRQDTNAFFWATVVLGAVPIIACVLGVATLFATSF